MTHVVVEYVVWTIRATVVLVVAFWQKHVHLDPVAGNVRVNPVAVPPVPTSILVLRVPLFASTLGDVPDALIVGAVWDMLMLVPPARKSPLEPR